MGVTMADARFKSRSYRRISKRTPKNGSKVFHERRKPGKAVCAICGKELHGVKINLTSEVRKFAKSQRTVARPYGGYICSDCLRKLMKERARLSKLNSNQL